MSTGAIVFFSTIVIVVIWAVAIYNQLVALKNRFKNGFAQIEVQLKRRYDLGLDGNKVGDLFIDLAGAD